MNLNAIEKESTKYKGVVIPMVTPITPEGEIDELSVKRTIDHLLENGVQGVFVLGTTGEAHSLSQKMRSNLVSITTAHVGSRARVYAGISRNCLMDSVSAGKDYLDAGVDVVVAHLPGFYPIGEEEQLKYFLNLAEKVSGPLMLYNIPIITHHSIPIDVIEELSTIPNVVGLKDSENDVPRLEDLITRLGGRDDFSLAIGVSIHSAKMLELGADGIVPSPGNLVPEVCSAIYERCLEKDFEAAKELQLKMNSAGAIYQYGRLLGQSLAALKAAMGALNLCGPDVLPPLHTLSKDQQEAVQQQFTAWQTTQGS